MYLLDRFQKDALLRLIDEVTDYAIILLDKEGNIQNWNRGAARIKGYQAEEIIGSNFRLFYQESDRKNGKPEKLIGIAKKEGAAHDEGWRVRNDGSKFWGSISIYSVHDDMGNIIGFGKVTRDLTKQRKADKARIRHMKELELKNEELEQFAYIASHDLQEPIRSLISFSDLLKEEYGNKSDQNFDQYVSFIGKSSRRMQELVTGLLEYSKIGKKKELEAVDLNLLLRDLLDEMTVIIEDSKAQIKIRDLPIIKGYGLELSLLFQNLISNAIKFTEKDHYPVIEIVVADHTDHWLFSISDNGIGIDEQYSRKIFTLFQRLHGRADYPGTGIGLSHCKKIVELHNGKIWVESEPGHGSTFKFTIPKS